MIDVMVPEPLVGRAAVSDLRSRRRRRRLGDLEWGDLAYRVYTTSLGTLVIAVLLSSWVGDNRVTGPTAQQVLTDGPAYAGLALAAMFLIGVRSGSRGGPIAMEPADVQHLMLAPVDRGALLRRPLAGVIGYGVLGGLVVGGLAGSLFHQRLPGSASSWILSGALFGATAVGITLGSALVTCSRILPRWLPLTIAWIIFLWAIADAAGEGPISPATYVGKMLFWPLEFSAIALVAVALAIVLPIVGARVIGGLSVEQARRRTALVGQLRFAVTQQDLRSVVLLRRNLASERPRNRPWVRWLPSLVATHFPTVGRDLRSVARWPIVRIVRVLVLGVTAGLALRGLWSGTTPLVLVAGLAIYVAGLDCTEPLAQEVDHPQITEGFPTPIGQTLSRHLVQPVIVMLAIGIVGLAAAYLVSPDTEVLEVGWIVVLTGALAGVAAATVSTVSGAFVDASHSMMMPPEVAGPGMVIKTVWPPVVAIIGCLPALFAHRMALDGQDPVSTAITVAIPVLVLVSIIFGWVRFRDDLHASMAEATGAKR